MDTRVAARQPDGCVDPDLLLLQFRDLVAAHPHMHGPEAAARLGVTEAMLMAARVGQDAAWLQPDLPALLESIPQWGKVLIASRLQLGVVLSILYAESAAKAEERFVVEGDAHQISIGTHGVAGCVLLEDHDAHGHTYSLNWFNRAGDAMGRVYLFSKTERKLALDRLRAHVIEGTGRSWQPRSAAMPGEVGAATSAEDTSVSRRAVATGRRAGTLAGHALSQCAALESLRLVCASSAMTQTYTGTLGKVSGEWPLLHASDAGIKLHAHLQNVTLAEHCVGRDGAPWLRFSDASGQALNLAPQGRSIAPAAWVSHVLAMEGAA